MTRSQWQLVFPVCLFFNLMMWAVFGDGWADLRDLLSGMLLGLLLVDAYARWLRHKEDINGR